MTPDQIAGLTAIAAIISKVGTWPILSILVLVVAGPWVAMWFTSRANDKRLEAAIKMYESNVTLVQNYEKFAEGLQSIVVLATQAMTQVKDKIDTNQFCPSVRKATKKVGGRG